MIKKILTLTLCITAFVICLIPLMVSADEGAPTVSETAAAITTDYGTIPAEYTDPAKYPIAVFIDESKNGTGWKYVKSFKDWRNTINALDIEKATSAVELAYHYLSKDTADVAFYFLGDISEATAIPAPHNYKDRTLTIDLNGCKLGLTQNIVNFNPNAASDLAPNFIIKNGTVEYANMLVQLNITNFKRGGFNVSFDKVHFIPTGTDATKRSLVYLGNYAAPTDTGRTETTAVNIEFKNGCTISEELTTSQMYVVKSTLTVPYKNLIDYTGETAESAKFKFNLICNEHSYTNDSDITCNFCGNVKEVPTIAIPGYGEMPETYQDATKYPIIAFKDTSKSASNWEFAGAYSTWAEIRTFVETTMKGGTADVAVYLRGNVDGGVFGAPDDYNGRTLIVDLGGFNLTLSGNLFYFNMKTGAGYDKFIVKNGTIKYSNTVLGINAPDYANPGGSFTFEGITFVDTNSSWTYKKSSIIWIDNHPAASKPSVSPIDITFTNCKIGSTDPEYLKNDFLGGLSAYIGTDSETSKLKATLACNHNGDNVESCALCKITVNLTSYSTSLGTTLGINFYAYTPANAVKAVINVAGVETKIDIDDSSLYRGMLRKFSSSVSSVNVRENITIKFLDKDGNAINIASNTKAVTDIYDTSVLTYAKELIGSTEEESENNKMAKALLTYAAYAELYFGKTASVHSDYEGFIDDLSSINTDTSWGGTVSAEGENKSTLGKVTLVLDNETSMKIELTKDVSFTDSENIKKVGNYIVISGIHAKTLNTGYTFSVDGVEVTVSAVGVAEYIAKNASSYGEKSEAALNLMKALYNYANACTPAAV